MTPQLINTERAVRDLVNRLYSPTRKLPVLVVTQTCDKTGPVVPLPKLQDTVGPLAKVYGLSGGVQKWFNRLLDHTFGISPSGVRLYFPGMTSHDPVSLHPLWNQKRIKGFASQDDFIQMVRSICSTRKDYEAGFAKVNEILGIPELQEVRPKRERTVLTVKKPSVKEEQIMALKDKFS